MTGEHLYLSLLSDRFTGGWSLPVLVEVEGKSRQDEGKEGDKNGRRHGAAVSVGVGQVRRYGYRA